MCQMKIQFSAVAAGVIIGVISTVFFMGMRDDALITEKKVADEKATELDEIRAAASKEVRDQIDLGKQRIEDTITEAKNRAAEANNAAENQLKLDRVRLESWRKINEAEQVLK